MFDDKEHRYAPVRMLSIRSMREEAVTRWETFPEGTHPNRTGLITACTAVKCSLANGHTQWFGCERAYINAELRMVIVGIDSRDEVRRRWEVVPDNLREVKKT